MRFAVLSLPAFAALAWAIVVQPVKRDWTTMFMILDGPLGASGQTFEMTVDNGKTWTGDARNMPLGSQATVGFRVNGSESTAFIAKVRFFSTIARSWSDLASLEQPY
jgi:hypothetical protein